MATWKRRRRKRMQSSTTSKGHFLVSVIELQGWWFRGCWHLSYAVYRRNLLHLSRLLDSRHTFSPWQPYQIRIAFPAPHLARPTCPSTSIRATGIIGGWVSFRGRAEWLSCVLSPPQHIATLCVRVDDDHQVCPWLTPQLTEGPQITAAIILVERRRFVGNVVPRDRFATSCRRRRRRHRG